ncbi:MAG: hypothetical protein PXZ08_01140 [Actinomycetota bacterium]|nr:hypothetical protein [Actinomycetota bacterium]
MENDSIPVTVWALTLAHADADNLDQVRVLLEEFAAPTFVLAMDATWLTGMVWRADGAIARGDPVFIEPIVNLLLPWPDRCPSNAAESESPLSQCLATALGRYEEAEEFLAHAMRGSDRTNAKFFAVRTHLLWGVVHPIALATVTPSEREGCGSVLWGWRRRTRKRTWPCAPSRPWRRWGIFRLRWPARGGPRCTLESLAATFDRDEDCRSARVHARSVIGMVHTARRVDIESRRD